MRDPTSETSQAWSLSDVVRKPFDIETLWFTEPLEAIGQPNGLNCEISLHDCRNLNVPVTAPVGK